MVQDFPHSNLNRNSRNINTRTRIGELLEKIYTLLDECRRMSIKTHKLIQRFGAATIQRIIYEDVTMCKLCTRLASSVLTDEQNKRHFDES